MYNLTVRGSLTKKILTETLTLSLFYLQKEINPSSSSSSVYWTKIIYVNLSYRFHYYQYSLLAWAPVEFFARGQNPLHPVFLIPSLCLLSLPFCPFLTSSSLLPCWICRSAVNCKLPQITNATRYILSP